VSSKEKEFFDLDPNSQFIETIAIYQPHAAFGNTPAVTRLSQTVALAMKLR
jgi:hypothetical protein